MNTNTYITFDNAISEIAVLCGDSSFSKGLSRGWYRSRIADAIVEINLDTLYQDMVVDLAMPSSLRLDLPEGMFNVKRVFVGSFDVQNGCCSRSGLKPVHWKKGFVNNGDSENIAAKIKDHNDAIIPSAQAISPSSSGMLFANEQNGLIMFGPTASSYTGVRLVGKGIGVEFGEDVPIPIFFKRYIVDYVCSMFFLIKMGEKEPGAATLYNTYFNRLESKVTGSRQRAKNRVTRSSGFKSESLKDYITGILHK